MNQRFYARGGRFKDESGAKNFFADSLRKKHNSWPSKTKALGTNQQRLYILFGDSTYLSRALGPWLASERHSHID